MNLQSPESARAVPDPSLIPFVRDFDRAATQSLLAGATTKVFQKGERILDAGETPKKLAVLISGMVELCGTSCDPSCGVLILTRGDILVPMATLYGEPSLTSANALLRTRTVLLDPEAVVRTASSNPDVGMSLARVMGAQWRMAVRHIIDLKSRSAPERLAAILLRFVDYAAGGAARLPFSKKTLAARLGVSRETLSRIIQVVADNGIVLRGSEIIVRDRQMAEEFSGPEPYANRSERRLDVHAF